MNFYIKPPAVAPRMTTLISWMVLHTLHTRPVQLAQRAAAVLPRRQRDYLKLSYWV